MPELETTERGFRVFGRVPTKYGVLRVQESSLACEGAHVWLFHEIDKVFKRFKVRDAQISVASARALVKALRVFIKEAEGDKLTEPAERPEE
jgi:hypothetical protein